MRPIALVLVGSRSLNKRIGLFLEGLHSSGFDPVLVALPRGRWDTTGIEDATLASRRGWVTLRTDRPRLSPPRRPQLIVALDWSVLPVATLMRRLLGGRLVYDEHDHFELRTLEGPGPDWAGAARSWCIHRLHAWCLPHVDAVSCIRLSGGLLKAHLETMAETVVELHNYPTRRWRARRRQDRDGTIAIVYIGGIWDVKGCDDMLKAFELLSGEPDLPPITLHTFGTGDPGISRRLRTTPGVTFHGASSYGPIVGFLGGHDCLGLVLLEATARYSLASTNCTKLFEYLAAGAAVLATEVGEIPSILGAVSGGWTLPSGYDAEALAERLREILVDPEEIRRRGEAAAAAMEESAMEWEGEWAKIEGLGVLDHPHRLAPPS